MSLLIRPFQNTDTQSLCAVLAAHYRAIGLPCSIGPLSLELCVLAKPYFESELLLVAEQDGEVVGLTQLGFEPDGTLQSTSTTQAVMSALCVRAMHNDAAIATNLIQQGLKAIARRGATHVRFCPPPPASPFFAGMMPGDAMIGVPSVDVRVEQWLFAAGWLPGPNVSSWELDLYRFQPPMDRMQIQIRRMAHVDRLVDEPLLPWYVASTLGHTEPLGFQLTSRQTRTVTADLLVWTISQELLPQPVSTAHLWPVSSDDCRQRDDQLVFLLAEAFRQLREDRVDLVRTIVLDADQDVANLLVRLGFSQSLGGTVFHSVV